ncbi:transglutaminase-like domain-containing protein [Paenibacillus eucommiae]|uniref:Transglutaminase-like putative cysteine protease n=1 Tax=Paenibacillus eucommiae TaxID=1355755 RepID=A0ABS4IXG6_9BACL|nr:transglutaminase-like domain-containing protein [Paenibacillus eucommiae]MBP1992277.1 transglutaminase-like putative cysteine protease [Paenibacillus eucommiae]
MPTPNLPLQPPGSSSAPAAGPRSSKHQSKADRTKSSRNVSSSSDLSGTASTQSAPSRTKSSRKVSSSSDPSGAVLEVNAPGKADDSPAAGSLLRDGALSLLLLAMLWEWLRPMPELSGASGASGVYSMLPFLLIFAVGIALDWLRVPYMLGWVIKAAALLTWIGTSFYTDVFLEMSWIWDFLVVLAQDGLHTYHLELALISQQSRVLLFLIGWLLLLSVAQALMLQKLHALWFIAVTIAYLLLLQLLVGIDTTLGVIRALGSGLALLALLNFSKIQQHYGVKINVAGWPARWLMISIVAAATVGGLGWFGHQSQAGRLIQPIDGTALLQRWESYFQQDSNGFAGAKQVIAKSGYSTDDSVLGGPLQSDDSLVFTATTTATVKATASTTEMAPAKEVVVVPAYWRGESKSVYDGKGWSGKEPQWEPFIPQPSSLSQEQLERGAQLTQEVLWHNEADSSKQIFYGGSLVRVDNLITAKGKSARPETVLHDELTGKVVLPEIADAISYYKITVSQLQPDLSMLAADRGEYPADIRTEYLQLPERLPTAIRRLAEQITKGLEEPYAKAQAIQNYLRSTYTYSMVKPTRPGRNEDFVSHFLFVDKSGYCDHFSTAMVVMLRSIGIPARWVKGFAPGEAKTMDAGTAQTLRVLAKDAHSWVEVYFPSGGWIPFEPTPGFTGPALLSAQEQSQEKAQQAVSSIIEDTGSDSGAAAVWLRHLGERGAALLKKIQETAILNKRGDLLLQIIVIGAIAVLVTIASLFVWKRHRAFFLPRRPIRLMEVLWGQIFRAFGSKQAHQTLREYIEGLQIQDAALKLELLELAGRYEEARYQPYGHALYSRSQIVDMWKNIQDIAAKSVDKHLVK